MAFITWFLLAWSPPPVHLSRADHCKYQHRDKNHLMTPHQEKVLDILLIVKQDKRKTQVSGHAIA